MVLCNSLQESEFKDEIVAAVDSTYGNAVASSVIVSLALVCLFVFFCNQTIAVFLVVCKALASRSH